MEELDLKLIVDTFIIGKDEDKLPIGYVQTIINAYELDANIKIKDYSE